MAILKILPEASKMNSSYWQSNQKIPNTLEEILAYKRIDSLEAIPKTFTDNFSWLSDYTWLSNNFSTVGTLSFYNFNKVEGNTLNSGIYYYDSNEKRLSSSIDFSYGFKDKIFKSSFSASYLLGKYRTTKILFEAFNNLNYLFSESDEYGKLLSTFTSLLLHNDFRNYYYSNGFCFNITDAIFPFLDLGIGFSNKTDKNSSVNTEFSFFKKDEFYKPNKFILEGKTVNISTNFRLDFRKYIEDGFFRIRTSQGKSFFTIDGDAVFSSKSILASNLNYQIYKLNLFVNINSFKSTKYILEAKGFYSTNAIPYQLMSAVPGNVSSLGKDFSFRTINIFSTLGDRVFTITSQYLFKDELFKMLKIPLIENARLRLDVHFNIAWLSILEASKTLNSASFQNQYPQFIKPFYEIGFGIGHQLIPLKIEFTWRLNYRNENSFVVAINSFAF